jgi:hypothetical protein
LHLHEQAGTSQLLAASVVAYTLPGCRWFHDGQLHGRRKQVLSLLALLVQKYKY